MLVTTRTSRHLPIAVLAFAVITSGSLLYAEDKSPDDGQLIWKKSRVAGSRRPAEAPSAERSAPAEPSGQTPQRATHHATHADAPSGGAALIQQAYAKSQQADSEGGYSTVIALCERGIRSGVSAETEKYAERLLAWSLNRRGALAIEMGRDEQALEDFEAAVRYDKTRWRAMHNRGVSYAMMGRHEEAMADFTRTIELNPRHANAYFNRGELRYESGRYDEALKDYDRAIRLTPEDASAHNSRGHTHYQLHDYPHAVRDFTEAIRLDPQNGAALANRGQLYSDLGYYARALRDFQRAVDHDPELGRAYQGAAWVLATCPEEKYRDAEAAVSAASKAIELDGDDDPLYLDTLAAAHANSGQFDMAQEAVRAALEKAPADVQKEMQRRMTAYKQKKAYRSRPQQVASVVKRRAKR